MTPDYLQRRVAVQLLELVADVVRAGMRRKLDDHGPELLERIERIESELIAAGWPVSNEDGGRHG